MVMRRREFLGVLGGAAAAWPFAARAQSPGLPIIGYLSTRSVDAEAPVRVPFLETLEKSGFSVGRNVAIEYRYADGQESRLPALAAELVARNASVLVALGRPTALAAKRPHQPFRSSSGVASIRSSTALSRASTGLAVTPLASACSQHSLGQSDWRFYEKCCRNPARSRLLSIRARMFTLQTSPSVMSFVPRRIIQQSSLTVASRARSKYKHHS